MNLQEVSQLSRLCSHHKYYIRLHYPHGPSKNIYWPSRDDICYVPVTNILCLLSPPSTSTGRTYNILDNDYENNVRAFNGTKGDLT